MSCFPFSLSSHNHIYIAKYRFSIIDDYYKNLGDTTVLHLYIPTFVHLYICITGQVKIFIDNDQNSKTSCLFSILDVVFTLGVLSNAS